MPSIRCIDFDRDTPALATFLDEHDQRRLELIRPAVDDGDAFVLVVDDEGVARGLAVVHLNAREDQGWTPGSDTVTFQQGDNAFLENMGVAGPLQGRGVGSQLLRAVEGETKRRGKRFLWLHSREANARAHRFYERHGWQHLRTVRHPWSPDIPRRVYRKEV